MQSLPATSRKTQNQFQPVRNATMPTTSETLDIAREKANLAFDRHCAQWDLLQAKSSPTAEDLDEWLSARDSFYEAQAAFEKIIRQISPS
jgi:hypothetical protein